MMLHRVGRRSTGQRHDDLGGILVGIGEEQLAVLDLELRLNALHIEALGDLKIVLAGVRLALLLESDRASRRDDAVLVDDLDGYGLLVDDWNRDGHEGASNDVDGEGLRVELNCRCRGDVGHSLHVAVVGNMEDRQALTLDTGALDRHAYGLEGLHFVALRVVDGDIVGGHLLEFLAVLGDGLLDRIFHRLGGDGLGLHRAASSQGALRCVHHNGGTVVGLDGQALGRIALLGLLRHGGRPGLDGGLGLVHLPRRLLRFRAVGLVLGLRLGLFDILQRGDDLSTVSLGGGVGARVVREHGHVQEREHQEHRQQD